MRSSARAGRLGLEYTVVEPALFRLHCEGQLRLLRALSGRAWTSEVDDLIRVAQEAARRAVVQALQPAFDATLADPQGGR